MKSFTPILLIVLGLAVFFLYVDPTYQNEIKAGQATLTSQNQLLENSKQLLQKRDDLYKRYTTIGNDEISRIQKLLPDTIDNVRLVIDLDGVAQRYGMSLADLNLAEAVPSQTSQVTTASDEVKYQAVTISFSVTTSYDVFLQFLKDLEQSLRVVDVTKITFSSTPSGLYKFSITLKTYWLK